MRLLEKFRSKSKVSSVQSRGSSNYAYSAARVKAMKSKLLPKETYPRLMNMKMDEIIRFIEESEYKQDVDELARTYEGIDLIEHALNRNLAVTFTKLINFTEGELNYILTEYLKNYDIWNIKTILRGKYYGASVDEIKESLVAAGQLSYGKLSALAEKDSEDDVIEALQNTPYYTILKEYEKGQLWEIENLLDHMYYSSLFQAIGGAKVSDRRLFMKCIRTEIDIKNITMLLRLKKYGTIDAEKSADLMIAGGLELELAEVEKLLSLSFEELLQSLEKYSYWNAISDIADSNIDSLTDLETQLSKYSLQTAGSFSHEYPLSIAPLMDYILNKKNEISNLRIIIRGKASNLSEELIKNQLVI